eukprot:413013_1
MDYPNAYLYNHDYNSKRMAILMNCTLKLDHLDDAEFQRFGQTLFKQIPSKQLKIMLFILMKTHFSDAQLTETNTSINDIIHQRDTNKLKEFAQSNVQIPKGASLSVTIPSEIIGSVVCPFLNVVSVLSLGKTDRRMAIVAFKSAVFSHLDYKHKSRYTYNPFIAYPHSGPSMAERFFESHSSVADISLFRNIFSLACADTHYLKSCPKLKQLTLRDDVDDVWELQDQMPTLTDLNAITFEQIWSNQLFEFLSTCRLRPNDSIDLDAMDDAFIDMQSYFVDTILNLKSISFLNCDMDAYEGAWDLDYTPYLSLLYLFAPTQASKVQTLRFECSFLPECTAATAAGATICDTVHTALYDINRLKQSLCNLQSIIFSSQYAYDHQRNQNNVFCKLSLAILNNLSSFGNMRSIHVHGDTSTVLNCITNLEKSVNKLNITELCTTINMSDVRTIDAFRQMCKIRKISKFEKICLVIPIQNQMGSEFLSKDKFPSLVHNLVTHGSLNVFQLVFTIEEDEDNENALGLYSDILTDKIQNINAIFPILVDVFHNISKNTSNDDIQQSKHPLIFNLEIRIIRNKHRWDRHEFDARTLQNVILQYISAWPKGRMNFKYLDNKTSMDYTFMKSLEPLNTILRVEKTNDADIYFDIRQSDPAYHRDQDLEHVTYSMAFQQKDNVSTYCSSPWIADCRFCSPHL